jgi:hypothetical protein
MNKKDHFESRNDLERWLRQNGLPVRAARKIAAGGFAALAAKAEGKDHRNETKRTARP